MKADLIAAAMIILILLSLWLMSSNEPSAEAKPITSEADAAEAQTDITNEINETLTAIESVKDDLK